MAIDSMPIEHSKDLVLTCLDAKEVILISRVTFHSFLATEFEILFAHLSLVVVTEVIKELFACQDALRIIEHDFILESFLR